MIWCGIILAFRQDDREGSPFPVPPASAVVFYLALQLAVALSPRDTSQMYLHQYTPVEIVTSSSLHNILYVHTVVL